MENENNSINENSISIDSDTKGTSTKSNTEVNKKMRQMIRNRISA